MNSQHTQCAVCGQHFTQTNLAWIMSMCGHNLCNQCLKANIAKNAKWIMCRQCNQKLAVDAETMQQFPKNIAIVKNFRDAKSTSVLQSKKQKPPSPAMTESSSTKLSSSTCPKHGKPQQIVCIVDRDLLCAHCAIFGEHHNHSFQTIDEYTTEYENYRQSCGQLLLQKQVCQENLRGKKYRATVISKISERKDKLMIQIRENFTKLTAFLKDAQSKLYDEVVKNFRGIEAEIGKFIKDETEVDVHFEKWRKDIEEHLREIQSVSDLKSKVGLYYKTNRPNLKAGERYLKDQERSIFLIKEAVEERISSIKLEYLDGLEAHIYNFAKVVSSPMEMKTKIEFEPFKDDQLKYLRKEMKIQFVKSNELTLSESSRENVVSSRKQEGSKTSRMSNQLNKVKSNPKLPKGLTDSQKPKKNLTPPKQTSKNTDLPKHTQNLQFAERMLNEFLASSDTLDITGCELDDDEIIHVVGTAAEGKQIKCLKVCKNKLTNSGLARLVPLLAHVTNINLSYNGLTDECVDIFAEKRDSMPGLRIINLGHNKINERKVKAKTEELKKYGIITTL